VRSAPEIADRTERSNQLELADEFALADHAKPPIRMLPSLFRSPNLPELAIVRANHTSFARLPIRL